MTEPRTLTIAELRTEARARFGDDPLSYAFVCPACGDVATVAEFEALGRADAAGQHCIGRELGALAGDPTPGGVRGCNWAAYGLFRGPWTVVYPDGTRVPAFPLAPAVVPS